MKNYQGTFRKLIVWQEAKSLTKQVYVLTRNFPSEEKFVLVSQMKRASISTLSNLAEGNERRSKKDKLHFFNIASSSLTELDCQRELAYELNYIEEKDYDHLLEQINKTGYLLHKLITSKIFSNNPS